MADDDLDRPILQDLESQLQQSRQQQNRLKDALTRALLILEADETE